MTFSSNSSFCSKVVCADCGGAYGSKVWHSNTAHRKEIWQCNYKFKTEGKTKCQTPNLTEEEIKEKFIDAYNEIMSKRESLIEDAEFIRTILRDTAELDKKIAEAQEEVEIIAMAVRNLVKENATQALSQEEYDKKYNSFAERYQNEVDKLQTLLDEKKQVLIKDKAMELFIETIKEQPIILEEWDVTVFNFMIEKAVVQHDKTIEFHFFNGAKVRV